MTTDIRVKRKIDELPSDAIGILELVEKIEQRTLELRKEIMRELRPDGNIIHLKLNKVNWLASNSRYLGVVSNICY